MSIFINYLKLAYKLSPVALILLSAFLGYFAYSCWQDEITANKKVDELSNEINQLKEKQIRDNEILAQNEQNKIMLENQSIKQQEHINELLKNNQCANELVPSAYADRLYNRANQIRQSANTSQPIK